jgi:RNA polymerase sigma-70 factor (family 1)
VNERLGHALMDKMKLDRGTFEAVYNLYWEKVFGICYHCCQDAEISGEMVQDIFCSMWERRESLSIDGPIENYLMKAAKYKAIDFLRSKPRQTVLAQECMVEHECNVTNCTENEVLYSSLNEQLGTLVDRLPCQCQQVYRLSRERGLDTREIAARLLISEKTAKNHLNKALKFLRLHLEDYR